MFDVHIGTEREIFAGKMFGCKCFYWSRVSSFSKPEHEPFSLPTPIPQWPQGQGFATGKINLGEIEVTEVTKFEFILGCSLSHNRKNGVSFYKPVGVPNGYFSLGHYCQSNDKPLRGFVLAARVLAVSEPPALLKPLDYTLAWSLDDGSDENVNGYGCLWLPQPPDGYKALGFVVTNKPDKPDLEEVRCVRADLTDRCEVHDLILDMTSKFSRLPFGIWNTRPRNRGMNGKGVSVGTFYGSSDCRPAAELSIACLKNLNSNMHGMPNLDQIHALIKYYGPTLFFHPDEVYLPSSVSWFFENGALLYEKGEPLGDNIDDSGNNLPAGGKNDGKYWIDLPATDSRKRVKEGNIESAKLYVHVKPALGGTFTDIAMWVFCPFNGSATIKFGMMNISLRKIGQHVGDWEHFTLHVSNLTGELWRIYFSQHSGGEWVDVTDLEFIEGNKACVYSSKSGHASYPHPGTYIQGSSSLGVGIRNDAARSKYYVDSSERYEIVAAEYLGDGVISEPCWLQYMREWGPSIVYNTKTDLDKIINRLPFMVRYSVESMFSKFPVELYGEEGPTGPKEKNNWIGDERW